VPDPEGWARKERVGRAGEGMRVSEGDMRDVSGRKGRARGWGQGSGLRSLLGGVYSSGGGGRGGLRASGRFTASASQRR